MCSGPRGKTCRFVGQEGDTFDSRLSQTVRTLQSDRGTHRAVTLYTFDFSLFRDNVFAPAGPKRILSDKSDWGGSR